jgi:hypothetical protein
MQAEPAPEGRRRVDTDLLFRQATRRVEHAAGGASAPEAEFFCECGDSRCAERIRLTLGEYEAIRAMPGRFLVLPGDEGMPFRRVVASTDRFSGVVDHIRSHASPTDGPGFGRGVGAN